MSMCVDAVNTGLAEIIKSYELLNSKLHLDVEDDRTKYKFESQSELLDTLLTCRNIMRESLKIYTYIVEDICEGLPFERTRDLYKRSGIRVTYAIIYHELKNVFEIVDIAASTRSDTITLQSIKEQDLDDVYVAMTSFILEVTKVYKAKFMVGGAIQDGAGKRRAVN